MVHTNRTPVKLQNQQRDQRCANKRIMERRRAVERCRPWAKAAAPNDRHTARGAGCGWGVGGVQGAGGVQLSPRCQQSEVSHHDTWGPQSPLAGHSEDLRTTRGLARGPEFLPGLQGCVPETRGTEVPHDPTRPPRDEGGVAAASRHRQSRGAHIPCPGPFSSRGQKQRRTRKHTSEGLKLACFPPGHRARGEQSGRPSSIKGDNHDLTRGSPGSHRDAAGGPWGPNLDGRGGRGTWGGRGKAGGEGGAWPGTSLIS